jgi:hypothetical protein
MSENKSIRAVYINEQCLSSWMMCAWLISQRKKLRFSIVMSGDVRKESFTVTQAALPSFKNYLRQIGLPIDVLMKECEGVFSLGTNYVSDAKDFMHVWGEYGAPYGVAEFHQILKACSADVTQVDVEKFSFAAQLTRAGFFLHPTTQKNTLQGSYDVGVNINVLLFVELLKGYCIDAGVIIDTDNALYDGKCLLLGGEYCPVDLYIDSKVNIAKDADLNSFSASYSVYVENHLPTKNFINNKVVSKKGIVVQSVSSRNEITQTSYTLGKESFCYIHPSPLKGSVLRIGDAAFFFQTPLLSDIDKAFLSISLFDGIFPWCGDFSIVSKEYSRRCRVAYQHIVDNTQMVLSALTPDINSMWEKSEALKHKESLFYVRGKLPVYEYDYFDIRWQLWLLMGLGKGISQGDPLVQKISNSDLLNHLQRVESAIQRALHQLNINTAVTER